MAYIAGRPYLRRELEMPAAAFHHAGAPRILRVTSAVVLHTCSSRPTIKAILVQVTAAWSAWCAASREGSCCASTSLKQVDGQLYELILMATILMAMAMAMSGERTAGTY